MFLGPGYSIDYRELISNFESTKSIQINDIMKQYCPSNMITSNVDERGYSIVSRVVFCVNWMLYSEIAKNYEFDSDLQFIFKQLLYDYFDFNQAINTFCGTQLFSISRSIIEHSRMAILCFADPEFKGLYFSDYTSDEKKQRYYSKRETKITEKLQKIADDATDYNQSHDSFNVKALISNLLHGWYGELSNNTGELFHLNEITFTKKLLGDKSGLSFNSTCFEVEYFKLIDEIIEYLLLTTEVTLALFWGITDSKSNEDFNFCFLVELVQFLTKELNYSRNIDIALEELRKQVLEIIKDE